MLYFSAHQVCQGRTDILGIDLVSLGQEEESLGVARRRVEETLTVGILADALEEGADGAAHAIEALLGLFLGLFSSLSGAAAWAGC